MLLLMKAIILSAGKGSRLYPLTKVIPKSLVLVRNKPILEHIIERLPKRISEIIIVTGYRGDKIKQYVSDHQNGKNITVVEQGKIGGTWGALLSAKEMLEDNEYFLVLNGDDIYKTDDMEKFLVNKILYGTNTRMMPKAYHNTLLDNQGYFSGFNHQQEPLSPIRATAGLYTLKKEILDLKPVSVGGDEYGIPQTLMYHKDTYPAKIVELEQWIPINQEDDLRKAEKDLRE